MSKQDGTTAGPFDAHPALIEHDLDTRWRAVVGRRSFLRGAAVAGAAALPGSAL
jgi:hypothetical protein